MTREEINNQRDLDRDRLIELGFEEIQSGSNGLYDYIGFKLYMSRELSMQIYIIYLYAGDTPFYTGGIFQNYTMLVTGINTAHSLDELFTNLENGNYVEFM